MHLRPPGKRSPRDAPSRVLVKQFLIGSLQPLLLSGAFDIARWLRLHFMIMYSSSLWLRFRLRYVALKLVLSFASGPRLHCLRLALALGLLLMEPRNRL